MCVSYISVSQRLTAVKLILKQTLSLVSAGMKSSLHELCFPVSPFLENESLHFTLRTMV